MKGVKNKRCILCIVVPKKKKNTCFKTAGNRGPPANFYCESSGIFLVSFRKICVVIFLFMLLSLIRLLEHHSMWRS